jgi:hypothetical protein
MAMTLVLRPLPVSRVANMAPGALVLAMGLGAGLGDDGRRVIRWVPAVVGVVLAARGYRLGVTVTDREVVVRGHVRTQAIPRESIAGITDWPEVAWHAGFDKPLRTRITAFRTGTRAQAFVRQHNADSIELLRRSLSAPGL